MKKKILVLDTLGPGRQELCDMLAEQQYPTTSIREPAELEEHLEKGGYLTVILDIDSVPVDNRFIRELTIKYPEVHFLCTSKDRFHPDLKDAICYHIYACLTKPVDPDELFYLLRSIYEDDRKPNK